MTEPSTDYPSRPFSVQAGRQLGLTRQQLDADVLSRPTHGVRSLHRPETLVERARALAAALPDTAAFSHVTAAQLHGIPLSYAVEDDSRLHVVRPIDCQRIRRPGVAGHRALHPREVVDVEGLHVVGLADTWVDLGELVGRGKPVGVDDLVVAGDAVASVQGNRAGLLRRLSIRVRPRGKVALLEAYESIRVGSASPRETLARLMLVRSGLPDPKLNHPIYASWDPSVLLGVGDLVWEFEVDGRLVRVVGEYQGEAFHSGRAQQQRDGWRRRGLEEDGWLVIEIWKRDMASTEARRATVLRFAEALAFPIEELSLMGAEPRFFSRHAIELAEQRDVARRYRCA